MAENNVMVVAGKSGAKSTFGAGLLHHVEKLNDVSVTSKIDGNERDYEQRVVERMWSQGKFPDQTRQGYVVTHVIGDRSYRIPTSTFRLVDLPGEQQENLLNPTDGVNLVKKITEGNVPDRESVETKYEKQVKPDFDRGQSPTTPSLWETTFLYHYYNADHVIFLINLHKIIYQQEANETITLAYDAEDVEHAVENFTDVAVVPTAVDLVGYDPDTAYEPTLLERIARSLLSPSDSDPNLKEAIFDQMNRGEDRRTTNVINYANQEHGVDFFSVAVPDKNRDTNNLKGDGNRGFVVKGFGEVLEWLK